MTNRAVQFESLKVHGVHKRVRRGEGFELSGLSPGVTLIHGPNGSGKSTTALVIQELLWPGRTGLERTSVEGWFRDGGSQWHIDINAGHVECTRDGTPGITPDLGPPENRHRYRLALPELIQDDDAAFAALIANESQGGYDLAAASDALGFRAKPKSRRTERQGLQDRRTGVNTARQRQLAIEDEAAKVKSLRKEREQATIAECNIDLLQKTRDCHAAEAQCRQIKLQLGSLPEGVAKLRGDEREKLDQLAVRRERLESELASERQRTERAETELGELKLPDEGVDGAVLPRLRGWQRRLSEVESDIRRQRCGLSESEAEAEKSRQKLGEYFTDDQLASIEAVEIGELSPFARQVHQLQAQQKIIEERRRSLDRPEPEEVQGLNEQQIRDGVTALSHWLASPTPAAKPVVRVAWPIIVAAGLVIVLGLVLAIVHHWAWAFIVLPTAGIVVADWWLRRPAASNLTADPRAVHRHSYEETGLQPPRDWEVRAIADLVRRLVRLAGSRAEEDERIRRLTELGAEGKALEQRQRELDERRREFQERLGLKIEITDEWLPLLVDNISSWQRDSSRAVGARAVLADLEHEQKALIGQINESLSPFGHGEVDLAESAAHTIEDLADRQSRHRSAVGERADAQRRVSETVEPGLRDVANQRRTIFERLGIDECEEPTIDDWLAERPGYVDLNKKLSQAEAIQNDRRQALADHEHLLKLDAVDIQQQIEQQRSIAAKRDALSEQIAGIEHDIEAAKAGHELSEALEDRDAATAALTDARDENGAAVVGAFLTKWVLTVAIERSRPDVFRRANELFVKFTHGTLHLSLDDHSDPPRFQAQRGSDPPRPVDELSTGERVQLLMAVRMAFLEQDEPTRVPLLLDEVLGTSDDARAGVIIDSVIEIAREGRQVFYFTAQHDEVGKWVARLQAASVPHKVIDLAHVRRLAATHASPLQIASVERPKPPAPDGMSYDDYGRALNVPGLDPAVEHLDGLHLWHLIDDVDQLHELLCCRITSWGQLQTLVAHGGADLVNTDAGQFERLAAAAKAVEEACLAWRIGRAKQIDREALLDADCVSDTFVTELAALAKENNGDAEKVLATLAAGEVKYWRTDNTDRLREHFLEHGYLSDEPPLSISEIRVRILAAVADDVCAGRISQAFIDRLVDSLRP